MVVDCDLICCTSPSTANNELSSSYTSIDPHWLDSLLVIQPPRRSMGSAIKMSLMCRLTPLVINDTTNAA